MIPLRYQNSKEIPEEIKNLLNKFDNVKKGLFLYGNVGIGKTHILYAIANKLIEENEEYKQKVGLDIKKIDWWVLNTTDMLRQIKREFDNKSDADLLNQVINYKGYLLLDDVGSEKLSDWVRETFYLILNKRYEEILPTIITSNYNSEQLADRIGDRTVSRIIGLCHIVELQGDDKRIINPIKIKINV